MRLTGRLNVATVIMDCLSLRPCPMPCSHKATHLKETHERKPPLCVPPLPFYQPCSCVQTLGTPTCGHCKEALITGSPVALNTDSFHAM